MAIAYIRFLTDLLNKDTRYSGGGGTGPSIGSNGKSIGSRTEIKKFIYKFKSFDYVSNSLVGHSLSWKNSRELHVTAEKTFKSKLWNITGVVSSNTNNENEMEVICGTSLNNDSSMPRFKTYNNKSLSDNEDYLSESEGDGEFVGYVHDQSNHAFLNSMLVEDQYAEKCIQEQMMKENSSVLGNF